MICFIPTKGRLNTKIYKLFQDVGIEVKHFIEPHCLNYLGTEKNAGGLHNECKNKIDEESAKNVLRMAFFCWFKERR